MVKCGNLKRMLRAEVLCDDNIQRQVFHGRVKHFFDGAAPGGALRQ